MSQTVIKRLIKDCEAKLKETPFVSSIKKANTIQHYFKDKQPVIFSLFQADPASLLTFFKALRAQNWTADYLKSFSQHDKLDSFLEDRASLVSLLLTVKNKFWPGLAKVISPAALNRLIYQDHGQLVDILHSFPRHPVKFMNDFEPEIHVADATEALQLLTVLPQYPRSIMEKITLPIEQLDKSTLLGIVALLPEAYLESRFIPQYSSAFRSCPTLGMTLIDYFIENQKTTLAATALLAFHFVNSMDMKRLFNLLLQLPVNKARLVYSECEFETRQGLIQQRRELRTQLQPLQQDHAYWRSLSNTFFMPMSGARQCFDYGAKVWADKEGHYEGSHDEHGNFTGLSVRDVFEPAILVSMVFSLGVTMMMMGLPVSLISLYLDKFFAEPLAAAMTDLVQPLGIKPDAFDRKWDELGLENNTEHHSPPLS